MVVKSRVTDLHNFAVEKTTAEETDVSFHSSSTGGPSSRPSSRVVCWRLTPLS